MSSELPNSCPRSSSDFSQFHLHRVLLHVGVDCECWCGHLPGRLSIWRTACDSEVIVRNFVCACLGVRRPECTWRAVSLSSGSASSGPGTSQEGSRLPRRFHQAR